MFLTEPAEEQEKSGGKVVWAMRNPGGDLVREEPLDGGDFAGIRLRGLIGDSGVEHGEFPGRISGRGELVEWCEGDVVDAEFFAEFSGGRLIVRIAC